MTEPATNPSPATRPVNGTGPSGSAATTRIARVVSEALAPGVLVAGICLAVGWHGGSPTWGIVTAIFASAIPIAYIVRGVRQGRYRDHHVPVREHRPAVITVAAASVVVGLMLMLFFDAPRDLVALVGAMVGGLALTLVATTWWGKVSLHTAVAAGTATTLGLVFGPWLHLSWAMVGAIAWARVRLAEHTPAKTIVGAILGAVAAGLVLPIVR